MNRYENMANRYSHLAPLLLRVVLGVIFVLHGYPKFLAIDGTAQAFGAIGIPAPTLMVVVVAAIETIGGLLLLAGFATRIVSFLLAFTMLVAILTAKLSMGFVNGWEFEATLLTGCLSLVLSGPVGRRAPESENA